MLQSRRKSKIQFFYPYKAYYIKESSKLKKFIEQIFKAEGKKLEALNYIFCSDGALLAINKQYLGHHYKTDIVTFNLSALMGIIHGESYISVDRVKINAMRMNDSLRKELLRVIFHGALHLCGYNDKTKIEILIMRKMEDHYLNLYLNN